MGCRREVEEGYVADMMDEGGVCEQTQSVSPFHRHSFKQFCEKKNLLPPVCFPHFLTSSPQLNSEPFGSAPGFASAQAPLSSAPPSAV